MRQRNALISLLILLPALLCSCCLLVFFAPILLGVARTIPLVFLGNQTQATILAIQPCQAALVVTDAPPGGFEVSTHSAKGVQVTVRYQDAHGSEHIGVTAVCTEIQDRYAVQDTIAIRYRSSAPQAVLLAKDIGVFQGFTAAMALLMALFIFFSAIFVGLLRRPRPQAVAPSMEAQLAASDGVTPMPDQRSMIKMLSEAAIGQPRYPTRRIGLKEALVLLHMRNAPLAMSDDAIWKENSKILNDHMIVAAMLLDLILQRRIVIVGSGQRFRRPTIQVIDPSPVGDPDTDLFLAFVQSFRADLRSVYNAYARNKLVVRVIDQLRLGGYLRVRIPTTGRYAQAISEPQNPLVRSLTAWIRKQRFAAGDLVASDEYVRELPWKFLYTTQTPEEATLVSRAQAALATNAIADDFTQALILLIAALYIHRLFFQDYGAQTNIFRRYSIDERKVAIHAARECAKQAPDALRAVYRIAKETDERIENPPSA